VATRSFRNGAHHPPEIFGQAAASDRFGASRPVPAVDAERLLCDEKEDRRRNTSERARRAIVDLPRRMRGHGRVDSVL